MEGRFNVILIFLFCTFPCRTSKAQEPVDTTSFSKLENEAIKHYRNNEFEKYYRISRRYLNESKKHSYIYGVGNGNYLVGSYYYVKSQYDSAYYYFFEAQRCFKKLRYNVEIAENLLNLAIISKNVQDYNTSEAFSVEALQYLEKSSDTTLRTALYNNLGVVFSELKDFSRSVSWYKKSLKLASTDIEILTVRNNIGVVYRERGEFEKALRFFQDALSVGDLQNFPEYRAMVIDNIGYTRFLQNGGGVKEMLEAKDIRAIVGNERGIISSSVHLGEYYLKVGESKIASEYLVEALDRSRKVKNIKSELSALVLLGQLTSEPEYLQEYIRIQDSIMTAQRVLRNTFASIRFGAMESEMKSLKLETQNTQIALNLESEQKNNFYLWGSIVALALVILFILLLIYQRKRKMEFKFHLEQLRTRVEEQDRISQQLHHDIANDLLHCIGQFDSRNRELKDDELELNIGFLESVYMNTVNVSHNLGSQRFKKVSFERSLQILLLQFEKASNSKASSIGLNLVNWKIVPVELQFEIYVALKELLSNVQKHANATTVIFEFEQIRNNLKIRVVDDGVGVQDSEIVGSGLVIIEQKIKDDLKGKFDLQSSSKGTVINMLIPIQ